eukprot:evm.model.scf_1260EXC.3 EVM.evm.TU.scf_1260EXC.3   scf_1260EXC:9538-14173(-)
MDGDAGTVRCLADGELTIIFSFLDKQSAARCQVVCKRWKALAGALHVRKAHFARDWGVAAVIGTPRGACFLEVATIASFVQRIELRSTDTLTSLAVKHGCDVIHLRVTNGLSSEHALTNRKHVYIPVRDAERIRGSVIHLHYIEEACREVLVIQPTADDVGCAKAVDCQGSGIRRQSATGQLLRAKRRMAERLAGKWLVDQEAAWYYLEDADWDEQMAGRLAAADIKWGRGAQQELSQREEAPFWWLLIRCLCPLPCMTPGHSFVAVLTNRPRKKQLSHASALAGGGSVWPSLPPV